MARPTTLPVGSSPYSAAAASAGSGRPSRPWQSRLPSPSSGRSLRRTFALARGPASGRGKPVRSEISSSWIFALLDESGFPGRVVVEPPFIDEWLVDAIEVLAASDEPSPNDALRNEVTPMADSLRHARNGELDDGECQENETDTIPRSLPCRDCSGLASSSKRRFEGEILAPCDMIADGADLQTSCFHSSPTWVEGREASSDCVGVHEIQNPGLSR